MKPSSRAGLRQGLINWAARGLRGGLPALPGTPRITPPVPPVDGCLGLTHRLEETQVQFPVGEIRSHMLRDAAKN